MNGIEILSEKEINERLKNLNGWIFSNNKIGKTFIFSSFKNAISMINDLQPFCDNIDHHPDIHIYYKKINFELQRFSVGGKVTDRDFTVAKEIEQIYKQKYFVK